MSEKLTMYDGFDENNAEQGPKKPFVVINYRDPEEPIVLYNGEAASVEEAKQQIVANNIPIDFDKDPDVDIYFEENSDSLAA